MSNREQFAGSVVRQLNVTFKAMADSDFPSGPWTGFYVYPNGVRGQHDLQLAFSGGRMTGAGADEVGQFFIEGTYDPETKEATWSKNYPDGHLVNYSGFREGPAPGIWGTWSIPQSWNGGFHIWPLGDCNPNDAEEKIELPAPKERTRVREVVGAPASDS